MRVPELPANCRYITILPLGHVELDVEYASIIDIPETVATTMASHQQATRRVTAGALPPRVLEPRMRDRRAAWGSLMPMTWGAAVRCRPRCRASVRRRCARG